MTPPEDLLPYDGKERRFRHHDEDSSQRARGLELVARLLGLQAPPPLEGLRYDLRFYSGGFGVLERLHIALPRTPAEVDATVARLGLATLEAIAADEALREEIGFLVLHEEEPGPLRAGLPAFVEEHRNELQPRLGERARVWFSPESGVNAWSLVYEQDGELYLIARNEG